MWWWLLFLLLMVWMYSNQALRIAPSPRGGMGVFATRLYAPGQLIERGKFLETRSVDVSKGSIIYDYVFQSPTSDDNIVLALGAVSLFNHAASPWLQNADHDVSPRGHVDIVSRRWIWPGEEILISYGTDYWESREVSPM